MCLAANKTLGGRLHAMRLSYLPARSAAVRAREAGSK